ncbi:MAG: D-alanyl-D-alanine carboxypeptidase [Clostridiales bacterium]|nr:D-alanyl-D-alanine carboxypeptidase [Clostridiales bacterium]
MKKSLKILTPFLLVLVMLFCALPVYAEGYEPEDFTVDADIALLLNLDGADTTVLYAKNPDKQSAPASLAKIATAATALEAGVDLQDTTTVSYDAIHMLDGTGSAMANLSEGEEVTVEQLLYMILLHSAGEACNVLAEHVAGSVDAFMDMVNDWAKSVGCEDTHFVNPTGLDEAGQYTTANDMAKMTLAALELPQFEAISTSTTYEMAATNMSGERSFSHRNSMLRTGTDYYYQYAKGIKTGTTEDAGRCVVVLASKDGYNYLCVIMQGLLKDYNDDGLDDNGALFAGMALVQGACDDFRFRGVLDTNYVVDELPVRSGRDTDVVKLVPEKELNSLVPTSLDASAVVVKTKNMDYEELEAPVEAGTAVGTAEVLYGGEVIAEIVLVTQSDVERSVLGYIVNTVQDIFSTLWARIVLALVVLLVIVYIVVTIVYNNRRKNRRLMEVKNHRRM